MNLSGECSLLLPVFNDSQKKQESITKKSTTDGLPNNGLNIVEANTNTYTRDFENSADK